MKRSSGVGLTAAALLISAMTVPARGAYDGFPTADSTDGKFIAIAGQNFQTFANEPVRLWINVPADRTAFQLGVFDGDTGRDINGNMSWLDGHWDHAPAYTPVMFSLYADPLKVGDKNLLIATFNLERAVRSRGARRTALVVGCRSTTG